MEVTYLEFFYPNNFSFIIFKHETVIENAIKYISELSMIIKHSMTYNIKINLIFNLELFLRS